MVFDQVSWSNTPMFHNTLVVGSSPTSSPRRTPAPTLARFSGNAHKTDLFELECGVFDQVSWSNTPMFHNTLVVGSSPTSSTTQSSRTREIVASPFGLPTA